MAADGFMTLRTGEERNNHDAYGPPLDRQRHGHRPSNQLVPARVRPSGLRHRGGPALLRDLLHRGGAAPRLRPSAPPGQLAGVRPSRVDAGRQLAPDRHLGRLLRLGIRSTVRRLGGGSAVPILLIIVGIGLFGAGMFDPDPLSGYPPGTPPTAPDPSLHRVLHDLFSTPVFTLL